MRSRRSLVPLLLALAALGAGGGEARAADDPARIGTVDLAAVRALHPLLSTRDPDTGLLLRPFAEGDPETLERLARERDEAHARAVAECEAGAARIRDRQAVLRRAVRNIEAEVEEAKRELKGRYAIEYAKPPSKGRDGILETIRRDLRRIDEQIGYRAATVEAGIRAGEAEIRALRERAFAVNAYLPAEAADLLARADREAREAVRRVAQARKLAAVLNRAAGREPTEPVESAGDPVEAHWRTSFGRSPVLYHAARDAADFAGGAPEENALADFRFRVRETLERFAAGRRLAAEELVVTGGTDVTAAAVEELLRKYGMRKERIAAVNEALTRFLEGREPR